jgi:hypothetical protein
MVKLHEALGSSSSHLSVSYGISPKKQGLTSTTFQPPVNGFSSSVSTRVKTIAYRHESTASSDPTTASPVFAFRYRSSSWVANVTRNTGTLLSSILPELICGSVILRQHICSRLTSTCLISKILESEIKPCLMYWPIVAHSTLKVYVSVCNLRSKKRHTASPHHCLSDSRSALRYASTTSGTIYSLNSPVHLSNLKSGSISFIALIT